MTGGDWYNYITSLVPCPKKGSIYRPLELGAVTLASITQALLNGLAEVTELLTQSVPQAFLLTI